MSINLDLSNSDSLTTAVIVNPRPITAPYPPEPGITRAYTADDVRRDTSVTDENVPSKPLEELTAQDFGLKPGGRKLPGNTDSLKGQEDEAVRKRYDELRLQVMAENDQSEAGRLRRQVAEP